MEGLEAALERARLAQDDAIALMGLRQDSARERNRLRKVSLARIANGRATEFLEALDWWGIPRPQNNEEAERAKSLLLMELGQRDAGSPGYGGLRAAGFELLRFWIESGNLVTATKVNHSANGGQYRPSAAVAFLADQLPHVGFGQSKRRATDVAYTIARAWLEQEHPDWTLTI